MTTTHQTLQDRLVKELRLHGISTVNDANVCAPSFTAAYNTHFTKPPKSDFNAHQPLRDDENLNIVLT
ncbi:integrase catalytic subunit [Burkholderia lata]|uniref:Integrase catalytic subunit n=1 Tax=Burkholderia lata (strain ATCC 17760 / DSM 23089 / LMG 22485 / NCIMB 9086 / R18194 / 383) TaxID=482957 RepID=A0A6P2T4B6_BURL3|nr:integrase catalytic subunit [Burkholderia lata]